MAAYKTRVAISFVLVVILIGGGATVSRWLVANKPDPERTDVAKLPPVVEVHRTTRADLPLVFTGYGTARADHQVAIAAQVTGQVVEVPDGINDGAYVSSGDLLLRIDDRDYQRQLDRARSLVGDVESQIAAIDIERQNVDKMVSIAAQEMDIARRELERLTDLFEATRASSREYDLTNRTYQATRRVWQNLVSQREQLDPRRRGLESTLAGRRADVALAELSVERCRVVAPFAGQIDTLNVEAGDQAQMGMQLVSLMDTQHIEIPIELPASYRPMVDTDDACTLTVESMPGFAWQGRIARVAPSVDTRSRTFAAFVEVDNAEQATPLTPGYFVTASVTGPTLEDVLTVPRGAIVSDAVFVANDTNAIRRIVHVKRNVGALAIVEGELADGDLVIVSNLDILEDGDDIRLGDTTAQMPADQSIAITEATKSTGASR